MKRKIEIYGKVVNHKLLYNQFELSKALSTWDDCNVRLVTEKIYKKRSDPQNRYYFGVVIHYFCEGYYDLTGERISPEEAHFYLKQRFNKKEVTSEITGEVIEIPNTTTKKNTIEFNEYMEECIKFIAEFFGITCPDPEQNEIK